LWFDGAAVDWKYFQDGVWTVVPETSPEQKLLPSHPSNSNLHLYYKEHWAHPLWLTQSGYRRADGQSLVKHKSNLWVHFVYECWELIGCRGHQNAEFELLMEYLISLTSPIKLFDLIDAAGMFEDGAGPTFQMAITSLEIAHGPGTGPGTGIPELAAMDDFGGLDFPLFKARFLSDDASDRDMYLAGFNPLLRQNKNSLSEFRFPLPYSCKEYGKIVPDRFVENHPPKQEVVYMTRACLYGAQVESIAQARLVVHLSGPVLWLRWAPCKENMEFIAEHWLSNKFALFDGTINLAARSLKNLSVRLVERPRTVLLLLSAEVFAVISLGRSAFTIGNLLHKDHLPECIQHSRYLIDNAERCLNSVGKKLGNYTIGELLDLVPYSTMADQLSEWWIYLNDQPGTVQEFWSERKKLGQLAKDLMAYWERLEKGSSKRTLRPLHPHCQAAFLAMVDEGLAARAVASPTSSTRSSGSRGKHPETSARNAGGEGTSKQQSPTKNSPKSKKK
jgi:hypothetical protein